jgi:flagellar assembly factor FliW
MTKAENTKDIKIKMEKGLLGFEHIHDYTLKPIRGNPFFFWLESTEGPGFLLTKPAFFFEEYVLHTDKESLSDLEPSGREIQVYTIVTVPENTMDMTANLLAPLFINEDKGLARQVVLHDTPYTTRHYLFPPEKRRDCG